MSFEVKNGGFGYGCEYLFRNVNFKLEQNDVLATLGPNGTGKTTMLKCMMNILSWREGGAFLNEKDVCMFRRKDFCRKVAYVPQARAYAFDCSVIDMVMMGRTPHIGAFSEPSSKDMEVTEEKISQMGISKLAERSCAVLSGGELQMVLIARALASEPEVLIMDEPESNLDYHNQLKILNTVKRLSQDMICIINTHYPEHALRVSNKALLLSKDGSADYGSTEDVITEESIGDVFSVNTAMGSVKAGEETLRYVLPISIR
ncbi:MAG: ABC transporter ATP-binding protein [Candidatus Methanoplasma sp.]|nr:ABC transporter ATP-binding protein [Candidatus Methanoplasma sp.]